MRYAQAEIEVTRPLAPLDVPGGVAGVALLVRRRGRLIGFVMKQLPGGTIRLSPDRIAEILAPHVASKMLMESARDELPPIPGDRPPLPSITIAVCTRDRPDRLARLLDSLARMVADVGSFDVLVVDNAPSDDRTRALVNGQPAALPYRLRYCREPRPGLDFARNRAVMEPGGELLAFLDDDVTVDPAWLAGLADAHAENPDAAAFTGLVLPLELETRAQVLFEQRGGFRRGFDRLRYQGQDLPGNRLYPCGAGIFGAGANMVLRRSVLEALDGFDEALDTGRALPGGGDLDIFYRVIRSGHPLVYEPRCLVFHEHRRTMGALRRQYWSWGLGFMAFAVKSYRADPPMRPRLRALVGWWFRDQLGQLRQSVRGRHPLPPSMVLAELWGGLRGLAGEYGRSRRRIERIHRFMAEPERRPGPRPLRVASGDGRGGPA